MIAAIGLAYLAGLNAIAAFWLAYVFTRPLGASFGDLLSQPVEYGGLGFGTIVTSLMFLAVIVCLVIYMTIVHKPMAQEPMEAELEGSRGYDLPRFRLVK